MENNTYVFVNEPSSSRSSQNRGFIYVLLLPLTLTDGKHVPYYVGSTVQLKKRLSNHKQVNWFTTRFSSPVPVLILGTFPLQDTHVAVKDLDEVLSRSGFWLSTPQGKPFKETPDNAIQFYAKNLPDIGSILNYWVDKWDGKGVAQTKPASNKMLNTPKFQLRKKDLTQYCESFNYGSAMEKQLIVNIAHNYEEYNGYSIYTLSNFDVDWLLKNRKSKLNKFFNYPKFLVGGKPVYFYPQQSLVNKITDVYS